MNTALNPEPKLKRVSVETLRAALAPVARYRAPKHVKLTTAIIDLVRAGSLEAGHPMRAVPSGCSD